MRYFFHVVGARDRFEDTLGQHCPDIEAAKTKAALISGELAQDLGWDDFAVLVIDEYGKEVLRHPIDR